MGEQVSKTDAGILCSVNDAWLVELDRPGLNYWVKAKLLELYTPDRNPKAGRPWGNQFWIGAVTEDHHDPDHFNGNWRWPHANQSVVWFDWGDDQPNDLNTQFCMTYLEYRDGVFDEYRDYFWNDEDCFDDVAHYICIKDGAEL